MTLKERLAKLNLADGKVEESARQSSFAGRATGAAGRISDKINRFQDAGAKPLLPEGGSFGQAPSKPRLSGAAGSRGEGVPRVASLGGGRAAVPLNVVKPRSVSSGALNSPTTKSESGGSAGSRGRDSSLSREASVVEVEPEPVAEERATTPVAESTPVPSPSASSSPVFENPIGTDASSLALPSGARTPGAMSVSSMYVETGSVKSGGERPDISEIDVTPVSLVEEAHSPLSSPIIAAVATPSIVSSSPSLSATDSIAPSSPPLDALGKGPLGSLRAPSRSGSVASLSSMAVEAAADDVADLSDLTPNVETPTGEPTGLGFNDVVENAHQDGEEGTEEQRASRVGIELATYEGDEADPVASGSGPARSEANGDGDAGEAKEPPPLEGCWDHEEEGARPETPLAVQPVEEAKEESVKEEEKEAVVEQEPVTVVVDEHDEVPPTPDEAKMPKVKCSDCAEELDLMELADHACAPSKLPPALTSPPTSPPPPQSVALSPTLSTHSTHSSAQSSRSILDLPEDISTFAPAVPDVVRSHSASPTAKSPKAAPFAPINIASSLRRGLSRSSSQQSQQSQKSQRSPVATLDRFVPQTSEDVPEDVPIDDYYGEDEEGNAPRSVPPPQDQFVPEDVADEEAGLAPLHVPTRGHVFPDDVDDESPVVPRMPTRTDQQNSSASSASMGRASSNPVYSASTASHLRAERKASASGPRSQSVYVPAVPGRYISSDDEGDGYEGGTVTILR